MAWALLAVLVAAVLALAACSGGGSDDGDGSDDGPDRSSEEGAASDESEEGAESDSGTTTEAPPATDAGPTTTAVAGVLGDVVGPVGLGDAADAGGGVEVRLRSVEPVEAEARLPGEVGGPAVAVTVEVANRSNDPVDLDLTTVDLATGDGVSAPPVFDPEREPLQGDLEPGDTRAATYVFTVAADQRSDISVRVRYAPDRPTVVFSGSVPGA
ncbi:MAG TPA: DUF4352 domain-containing protein [Acidimicrobiales bacterium]